MSLIYNATFDSQTRILSLLDKAGNVISSCEVPSKTTELTLTATVDNSSVKLTKNGTLSNTYEVDTGSGWTAYTFGTVINLNKGQSCKWRCTSHPTTFSVSTHVQFGMTGTIEASGSCNSMLSSDFKNITSLSGYDYAFYKLFMGCESLTRAPELPATTLSYCCYFNMFKFCKGLIQAPVLPATTIAYGCYNSMFEECEALTEAPELPATTLTERCYSYMFAYCRSLTKAPEQLPATTLTEYCYTNMFSVCNSLTKAPLLPATTLTEHCYSSMFRSTSLREVRIAATDISANNCIASWMQNVPATGDFYCDPNTTFPSGMSGMPSGWTRRDINLLNALTLTATADNSSVKLTKNGTLDNTFEVDTGNGWTAYEFDTVIPLNAGQSCKWRCSAHPTTQTPSNYVQFVMTGTIEASGNCNSMLSSDFEGITSLTGYSCAFMSLFSNCTSLTKAPELPATALSLCCHNRMFFGCKSLKQAPSLPATTLANDCYFQMFFGCESLVKSPELPATTLAVSCYTQMFRLCPNLKEVRIAATTKASGAAGALFYWLKDVSSTGDFYCDPNATIFPADSPDGIPKGWTRHALADYPVTP